jgi:hypothetical protein
MNLYKVKQMHSHEELYVNLDLLVAAFIDNSTGGTILVFPSDTAYLVSTDLDSILKENK